MYGKNSSTTQASIDADWTPEELEIFELFDWKCIWCGFRKAVTLHEIVPKSKRPKTWMQPENRVPVCNICHELFHARGASKFSDTLKYIRQIKVERKNVNVL